MTEYLVCFACSNHAKSTCIKCGVWSCERYHGNHAKTKCEHRFIRHEYLGRTDVCQIGGHTDVKLYCCDSCKLFMCGECGYYDSEAKRYTCSSHCWKRLSDKPHYSRHILQQCHACGEFVNIEECPTFTDHHICKACQVTCTSCDKIIHKGSKKCVKCQEYLCWNCTMEDMCSKCVEYCIGCNYPLAEHTQIQICDDCGGKSHANRCAKTCNITSSCSKSLCSNCAIDTSSEYRFGYRQRNACKKCYKKYYKQCNKCAMSVYKFDLKYERGTKLYKCSDCATVCKGCDEAYPIDALLNDYCASCTQSCDLCEDVTYFGESNHCYQCGNILCYNCTDYCEECSTQCEYDHEGNSKRYCSGCLVKLKSEQEVCHKHAPEEYFLWKNEQRKTTVLELAIASKSGFSRLPPELLREVFAWLGI